MLEIDKIHLTIPFWVFPSTGVEKYTQSWKDGAFALKIHEVLISMDEKGRWAANVFIE